MHIEYTTLQSSNTKYIADFGYSAVSSTPRFRFHVMLYDGSTAQWTENKELKHTSEGQAAINEICEVLKRCQEFTTLHVYGA